ncbi:uncharacterized protein LOC106094841 isoform X2 [Stomoxys calcitrans]|uniref:Uncharacterized protein n=1 Tax=Stomoxys calcitrans TaxID=35570 RepID=A0A1I8P612_STOCA|nr:uncharacterized protein LOC106094841 isoform X2 [Stomoxys calcitrans]
MPPSNKIAIVVIISLLVQTNVVDLLYYLEGRPIYTYEEAKRVCLNLKMTKPYHVSGIEFSELPIDGEIWVPNTFPSGDVLKYSNGSLITAWLSEGFHQRLGFVCVAILKAAILGYRNGSVVKVRTSEHGIPSRCYPQRDLRAHNKLEENLAMCILIYEL